MEPIAVAMSGGVDSSVAAWLLQQEGYRPAGVTMRLFSPQQLSPACRESCNALKDLDDAQKVAQKLGIPHHAVTCPVPFAGRSWTPL